MPGPLPSNSPKRKTRPTDVPWIDLPRSGNPNPIPVVPRGLDLGNHGLYRWYRLWRTPESTQWGDADRDLVMRLCQLEDAWQRSVETHGEVVHPPKGKSGRSYQRQLDLRIAPEMRQLEEKLGLTAKAKKELRWRIVDDSPVEPTKIEDAPSARRRGLRVV